MTEQEVDIWMQLAICDQVAAMGPASRELADAEPKKYPVSVRYYAALDEIAAGRPHEWVLDDMAWFNHTGRIPLEPAS
jgi:hypothetical protein